MEEKDKFWSMIFIILGVGLIFFGLKDFLIPAVAVLLGFMLTNYGLRLRHKAPLMEIIKEWLSEFK